MIEDIQYGCVRFEDVHQHDRGWACVADGKPFRIKGTEDLSSDVVWMTNLSYELIYSSGLSSHARFRRNDFLSIKFCEIDKKKNLDSQEDWIQLAMSGVLGLKSSDWPAQVKYGALLFKNVMSCAHGYIGIKGPPLYGLPKGIRTLVAPPDMIIPDKIHDALSSAMVDFVMVERDFALTEKVRGFTFTLPRVEHAMNVLSTPIPIGDWKKLSKPKIPKNPKEIYEWLGSFERPILAKITITQIKSSINRLINFGSGRYGRRWVCSEELFLLAECCEFKILEVYYNNETVILRDINDVLNKVSPEHELSISAGIALENIWKGLCSEHRPKPHILRDQVSFNAASTFLRAVDRGYCFNKSVQLQRAGFLVTGYGSGKVIALTDKNDLDIANACLKIGITPPCLNLQDIELEFNPENFIEVMIALIAQGDLRTLIEADNVLTKRISSTYQ